MKYISLDEQKELLLDLLCELDCYCKKNNCPYFLIGGTLLGAIRHKGFIPWDDDIDVCMFRNDYENFIKSYKPSHIKYKLLSVNNDNKYIYPFAKLINDETVLMEYENDKNGLGVYVDIFPIDNCPGENHSVACKYIDKLNFLRTLRNFKIIKLSKNRKLYKNIILLAGKILSIFISRRKIAELVNKKASLYKNTECKYVGELVNTAYGYGEVYEKELFGKGVEVVFENHIFIAPENYDAILKSMYGDYMTLPPEDKRVSRHDIKCWYK